MTDFPKIDKSWTLFLDRDGVINQRRFNDYVKTWEEFIFLDGVLEAIAMASNLFGRIFVVTNQQGIGKGIMNIEQLENIHGKMLQAVSEAGGKIDRVYYCPALAAEQKKCRKPEMGMAEQAKKEFPAVDLRKSIMIGDSVSDIQFGKKADMLTVFVDHGQIPDNDNLADFNIRSLKDFPSLLDVNLKR